MRAPNSAKSIYYIVNLSLLLLLFIRARPVVSYIPTYIYFRMVRLWSCDCFYVAQYRTFCRCHVSQFLAPCICYTESMFDLPCSIPSYRQKCSRLGVTEFFYGIVFKLVSLRWSHTFSKPVVSKILNIWHSV